MVVSPPPPILVADPDCGFRELYGQFLQGEGFQVQHAGTGEEAWQRLQQDDFDVVLASLDLAEPNGLQLLRQSGRLQSPPDMILLTAHATLSSALEALKLGARDYLIKPFPPEELRHTLRQSLSQRRLLHQNQQLTRQLQLYQKGQTLQVVLDPESLLEHALELFLSEMPCCCGCAFQDMSQQQLRITSSQGLADTKTLPWPAASRPLPILEMTAIPASWQSQLPRHLQSLLVVPLQQDNKGVLAGLLLFSPRNSIEQALDIQRLNFLMEQAQLAYANAYKHATSRTLAITDELTQLYNYRHLRQILEHEIVRAERYGSRFSLLFLDLDLFKQVNDQYGHYIGSQLLRNVGQYLQSQIRSVDKIFRYGGDEFTILLAETERNRAAKVADRIRQGL